MAKAQIELPKSLSLRFKKQAAYLKIDESQLLFLVNAINDYSLKANLIPGKFRELMDNPDVDFYRPSDVDTLGGFDDERGFGYSIKIVKPETEIKHETIFIDSNDYYENLNKQIADAKKLIEEERAMSV